MRLILGSSSPRRHELLGQLGIVPDEVRPADIDETPLNGERPLAYCRRIAAQKARALDIGAGEVLLTADTTVALGRRILGKPADADEAGRFLKLLEGRRHRVVTAVAVRTQDALRERAVVSTVRMRRLTQDERAEYLASGEWRGKAGGYGIQGRAGAFIPWISGSFSAVVGLPLNETALLLRAAGYRASSASGAGE